MTITVRHYGLTAEKLNLIINYDIKYRLGGREQAMRVKSEPHVANFHIAPGI
jgi:uncharacterized protein YcfJ